MAAPNAFHYIAVFPRVTDAPRPAWPMGLLAQTKAIAGVVDAIFPDLTASWVKAAPNGEAAPHIETRRRFIEVYTRAESPSAARETKDALVALLDGLKAQIGAASYTLVTIPITDVEVR